MRVLIAVTHLLGAGHLTRAAAVARALAEAGHETVLVSGGMPSRIVRCGGARLVQLPPLRIAGTAFSRLLDGDGDPADAALLENRRVGLLAALDETAPDVVVTELFPFGRRALAAEFLALVETARARRPRPLVFASVRDILVAPDKPERVAQAHARLADLYDGVLVHGDPVLVPLDASWPLDAATRASIRYTGYVDEGGAAVACEPRAGVLVAAGSGAAGLGLFSAAAEAARRRPELDWRLLVGHGVPESDFLTVGRGLPTGTIARAQPDYRAYLAAAALSVSQCGYNTAVDLLATGTPALLVPFEAGSETEQRLRADVFAARGFGRILRERDLSPDALIAAVTTALDAPRPRPHGIDLDGAARTVAVIEGIVAGRKCHGHPIQSPHPEVPKQSGGLEGALHPAARALEPSFEAARAAPQDEVFFGISGLGGLRSVAQNDPLDRLRATLDAVADHEKSIAFWWRDDDAVAASPALERLLALAATHDTPLMLAAIPAKAEPSLARRLAHETGVGLAIHGLAHENHAPAGEKPAEFGAHRPLVALVREAASALDCARKKFPPDRLLPVFVPPWNRIAPDLAAALPSLGYRGLSASMGPSIPGLARADATLDPIDWRGTRSVRDPGALVDGLIRDIADHPHRPIGLLTHHRVHDEAVWDFLDALLPILAGHPAIRVRDPRHLSGVTEMDLSDVDAGAAKPSLERTARVRVG